MNEREGKKLRKGGNRKKRDIKARKERRGKGNGRGREEMKRYKRKEKRCGG